MTLTEVHTTTGRYVWQCDVPTGRIYALIYTSDPNAAQPTDKQVAWAKMVEELNQAQKGEG